MRRAVVRLVAIAMLAAAARRSGGHVVVQPGEDVQAAIVGVRERPRPRVVELAAGRHVLTRPLVLTGADSGLILQGPAIGDATIVGSLPNAAWTSCTHRPDGHPRRDAAQAPFPRGR